MIPYFYEINLVFSMIYTVILIAGAIYLVRTMFRKRGP